MPTSWVYEQSRQGRIPTVALGRYRRFRQEAIGGGSSSSRPVPGELLPVLAILFAIIF